MSLASGTRLGPYEIVVPSGGMGEVYRAKDAKLNRDVAIKALPATVGQDAERLSRFRREAQTLASLNHSNIAAIYGLDEADGKLFLVLELVEGEELADRLKRGAIPVDEALEIARQMAAGLEEAHEKGIVHHDLKPSNVKLTSDGKVEVLDFGVMVQFEINGHFIRQDAERLRGRRPRSVAAWSCGSGASPVLSKSPTIERSWTKRGSS